MPPKSKTAATTEPKGELHIQNFRKIKEVRLSFDRSLVVIGGRNGQGKTSVCTAVAAAIGGKRAVKGDVIRDGERQGHVLLTLGDVEILRTFNAAGGWDLTYRGADGVPENNAQKRLDLLVNKLSFDPGAFFRADAKEQSAMLLAAAGVDFSTLDAERDHIYGERTLVGRERDKLKGALDKYPLHWDPPSEEINTSELSARLQEAMAVNGENRSKREALERRAAEFETIKRRLNTKKAEVEDLKHRLSAAQEEAAAIHAEGIAFRDATNLLQGTVDALQDIDTTDIGEQLANADKLNKEYHDGRQRAQLGAEFKASAALYDEHSATLKRIEEDKRAKLASAKLPLPGLSIDEDGITLDGRPIALASSAERLSVAMAIALASVDPSLPIICMDGGEAFDGDSLKIIEKMADNAGAVVLMTRVARDGTCTILLEDGQEVGAEAYAEAVNSSLPFPIDGAPARPSHRSDPPESGGATVDAFFSAPDAEDDDDDIAAHLPDDLDEPSSAAIGPSENPFAEEELSL